MKNSSLVKCNTKLLSKVSATFDPNYSSSSESNLTLVALALMSTSLKCAPYIVLSFFFTAVPNLSSSSGTWMIIWDDESVEGGHDKRGVGWWEPSERPSYVAVPVDTQSPAQYHIVVRLASGS